MQNEKGTKISVTPQKLMTIESDAKSEVREFATQRPRVKKFSNMTKNQSRDWSTLFQTSLKLNDFNKPDLQTKVIENQKINPKEIQASM
jgi:hypothetical protein